MHRQNWLTLLAKAVTGRMLVPELLYGPEKEERSIVHAATVSAQELAEAVLTERDYVMGYPQLKSLYRVGDHFLNPADLFCTLAKALREGTDTVEVQTGRLAAADHVDESYQFGATGSYGRKTLMLRILLSRRNCNAGL